MPSSILRDSECAVSLGPAERRSTKHGRLEARMSWGRNLVEDV